MKSYYEALTVGAWHNYYLGRAEADITGSVAYFIQGMATSFEKVEAQASREAGSADRSEWLRRLDPQQRKALTLFAESREVTAKNIAELFGFLPRSAAALCQKWVASGFLVVTDPSRKARRYRLADEYEERVVRVG